MLALEHRQTHELVNYVRSTVSKLHSFGMTREFILLSTILKTLTLESQSKYFRGFCLRLSTINVNAQNTTQFECKETLISPKPSMIQATTRNMLIDQDFGLSHGLRLQPENGEAWIEVEELKKGPITSNLSNPVWIFGFLTGVD